MTRNPKIEEVVRRSIQSSVGPHLSKDTVFPLGLRFLDLFDQSLGLQVTRLGFRNLFWHQHPATTFIEPDGRVLLDQLAHEQDQAQVTQIHLLKKIL